MEELIPFIFFILWFIFGGIGSKKKREEMRQRAEAQREAQEAMRRARAEQRRAMRESREADGRVTFPEAREERELFHTETTTATTTSSADTSLDMIPDELWNILTGGAPRPTQPPRQPSTEREPVGEGGWVTSPPWDEEDAVHSIEGVSAEAPENTVDYDDDALRHARARYEDLQETSWEEVPTSRDAIAVRQAETSDARHVAFHDSLKASEIGAPVAADRGRGARVRLGLQGMDDVRRAIVLAEILGPPKALR